MQFNPPNLLLPTQIYEEAEQDTLPLKSRLACGTS